MVAEDIRGSQFVEECAELGNLVRIVDLTVSIFPEIGIGFALEFQHPLKIHAVAGGGIGDDVQGELIDGICGDILQEQAVGDIQKFYNRAGGILDSKGDHFFHLGIVLVAVDQLVVTGFQFEGSVLIRQLRLICQIDHLILHIVGHDAAIGIGYICHRELKLLTGIFDYCTVD